MLASSRICLIVAALASVSRPQSSTDESPNVASDDSFLSEPKNDVDPVARELSPEMPAELPTARPKRNDVSYTKNSLTTATIRNVSNANATFERYVGPQFLQVPQFDCDFTALAETKIWSAIQPLWMSVEMIPLELCYEFCFYFSPTCNFLSYDTMGTCKLYHNNSGLYQEDSPTTQLAFDPQCSFSKPIPSERLCIRRCYQRCFKDRDCFNNELNNCARRCDSTGKCEQGLCMPAAAVPLPRSTGECPDPLPVVQGLSIAHGVDVDVHRLKYMTYGNTSCTGTIHGGASVRGESKYLSVDGMQQHVCMHMCALLGSANCPGVSMRLTSLTCTLPRFDAQAGEAAFRKETLDHNVITHVNCTPYYNTTHINACYQYSYQSSPPYDGGDVCLEFCNMGKKGKDCKQQGATCVPLYAGCSHIGACMPAALHMTGKFDRTRFFGVK